MKQSAHLSNRSNQNILLANGTALSCTVKNIYTKDGCSIGQVLYGKIMYTVISFARSCWKQVTLKHERSSVAKHNSLLASNNYYNRNSKRSPVHKNRRISRTQSLTSVNILKDLYANS